MTDQEIREVLAPFVAREFTIDEFADLLLEARRALVEAGARDVELSRAGVYLGDNVMSDPRIPHHVRAGMLPIVEEAFGAPLLAMRVRVASDENAWRAMQAGGVSDDEIEEYLAKGHRAVQGLGWKLSAWLIAVVAAGLNSRLLGVLVLVGPVAWFIVRAIVRGRQKRS